MESVSQWMDRRTVRVMPNAVEAVVTIETLADRLELELGRLEACWREVRDEDRAAVILRICSHAPGVARLLCPQFGRFTRATAAQSGRAPMGSR